MEVNAAVKIELLQVARATSPFLISICTDIDCFFLFFIFGVVSCDFPKRLCKPCE